MSSALRILLVGVMAACARRESDVEALPTPSPSPPGPSEQAPAPRWTTESASGTARLEAFLDADGGCRLRATYPGGSWESHQRLAGEDPLRFLSDDGQRLLVLDPLPLAPEGLWSNAPVVFLYSRDQLEKQTNAGALVKEPRRLRKLQRRFGWLSGAGGVPGAAPQLERDGRVHGRTADDLSFAFGFDGKGIPAPVRVERPGASGPAAQTGQVFTWEDRAGELHFTNDPRTIPAQYRKRARTTEGGDVSVMDFVGARDYGAGSGDSKEPSPARANLGRLQVLVFTAAWCGYCKKLEARGTVNQLARRNPTLSVQRVDIDREPQLAARHGVKAVPTLWVTDASGRHLAQLSASASAEDWERKLAALAR